MKGYFDGVIPLDEAAVGSSIEATTENGIHHVTVWLGRGGRLLRRVKTENLEAFVNWLRSKYEYVIPNEIWKMKSPDPWRNSFKEYLRRAEQSRENAPGGAYEPPVVVRVPDAPASAGRSQ